MDMLDGVELDEAFDELGMMEVDDDEGEDDIGRTSPYIRRGVLGNPGCVKERRGGESRFRS